MHVMRLMHAAQIAAQRCEAMSDPAVDKDVVDQEISDPVSDHAQRDSQQRRITPRAEIEQGRSGGREHEAEQVIPFESAPLLTVMRFMDKPQGAVHDVAMEEPGNAFHCEETRDRHAEDDPELRHECTPSVPPG